MRSDPFASCGGRTCLYSSCSQAARREKLITKALWSNVNITPHKQQRDSSNTAARVRTDGERLVNQLKTNKPLSLQIDTFPPCRPLFSSSGWSCICQLVNFRDWEAESSRCFSISSDWYGGALPLRNYLTETAAQQQYSWSPPWQVSMFVAGAATHYKSPPLWKLTVESESRDNCDTSCYVYYCSSAFSGLMN